jgi:integrase
MKGRERGHVLPFVGRARLILERRRDEATPFDKFVFGTRTATGHAPGPTRNTPFALPDFRGHDLRRTAATLMATHGITRFVVARVLAHVDTSITAVYDQYEYLPEKRTALETLDRVITTILTPDEQQAAAPLLPFARV